MVEMVEMLLNGKYPLILPKFRADRPQWHTESGWERARLDKMHEKLKQGDVLFYVGAEEGEMPALAQSWGAQVVLWEPNPKVWPNIRSIWDANHLPLPLGTFAGFAGNVTDEHPVHLESIFSQPDIDGWPACAYGEVISNHGFRELYQEADAVPQIRIDDYVARTGVVPDAITFDCEGSDWQVMRGAENTVRDHHPLIFASIHPEFMFHQFGEYSRDFRNWIKDFGYDEQILEYEHELHVYYEPV